MGKRVVQRISFSSTKCFFGFRNVLFEASSAQVGEGKCVEVCW